jgi:hypothetical protein
MWARVSPVPNYSIPFSLVLDPHHPVSCIMTTLQIPDAGSHSATTAVLDAEIETLSAAKDTSEIIPVKVVFESVVVILTLVRVRVPVLSPCSRPLLNNAIRTR